MLKFFDKIASFINKHLFNEKWRCNVCGKEIFNDKYFCDECEKSLPYNDKLICDHCGRKVSVPTKYCQTCKDYLTSIDIGRSVFNYEKPISGLIKSAKYNGKKYLLKLFAEELSVIYFKNLFTCNYICYVPMTKKSQKKRGYNQSMELARNVSDIIKVPVIDAIIKTKETSRQATLNRKERINNLKDAFKVTDKKTIKDKSILLIDDVSTTGSTAECIAQKLKNGGAKQVVLLSVASVPPADKY